VGKAFKRVWMGSSGCAVGASLTPVPRFLWRASHRSRLPPWPKQKLNEAIGCIQDEFVEYVTESDKGRGYLSVNFRNIFITCSRHVLGNFLFSFFLVLALSRSRSLARSLARSLSLSVRRARTLSLTADVRILTKWPPLGVRLRLRLGFSSTT
jgi:hypothetical protein